MASKSKRRRKVLGASCILAALIIAGSSFAWFTSKDEVTNKLTATADYGVTLVEDFKPPKDMTPGQEVNKDVSVVNTGSIDSFVRMSLEEKMNMSRLSSIQLDTATNANNIGLTYYKNTNGTIGSTSMKDKDNTADSLTDEQTRLFDLKGFGDPTTANGLPTLPTTQTTEFVFLNPRESINADGSKEANEVTTLMAGGQVVVAESKAVAPDATAVRSGDDVNGASKFEIIYKLNSSGAALDGQTLIKEETATPGAYKYFKVDKNQDGLYVKGDEITSMPTTYTLDVVSLAHDYSGAEQYVPTGTGLYLFKRTNNGTAYKYSGFYYNNANKKFYALKTEENNKLAYVDGITVNYLDGVVDSVSGVELRTKETGIDNTKGEWKLEFINVTASEPEDASTTVVSAGNEATATHLKATFHVDSDNNGATPPTPVTTKDVIFYIKLSDGWSNNWQFVKDNSTGGDTKDGSNDKGLGYFYYRTPLDSGETSAPLIDSVKLNKNMGSQNYLDMVYDLKVALETAQVTKDQYGKETAEAVVSGNDVTTKWAVPTLTKNLAAGSAYGGSATIKGDGVDGTIDGISWAPAT